MFETDGQDSQVGENQEVQSEEPIQGQQESSQDSQSTGGINPAWNELLENLPAGLHSQVTPHLTKWDQNFQSKINEVHSQYEPYKRYMDNQVNPEQIDYALGLFQAIEERPQEVLQALQAYIGIEDEEQGQDNQQENGPEEQPEIFQHPEYQRMQEMVETMAQLLVQQRQSEEEATLDDELENDLKTARDTHGDFDEEWVLNKLYHNPDMELDEAVQAYKQYEQGIISKSRKPGPPVLGAGGSVPNPDFSPGKLDSKDRKSLVAQMLAQSQAQNH